MANYCFNSLFAEFEENTEAANFFNGIMVEYNKIPKDKFLFLKETKSFEGIYDLELTDSGTGFVSINFESRWSEPKETIEAICLDLAGKGLIKLNLSFEESGNHYAGQTIFQEGALSTRYAKEEYWHAIEIRDTHEAWDGEIPDLDDYLSDKTENIVLLD